MISKAKLGIADMICVDCGHPVVDDRNNQGQGGWLTRIAVVLGLLMLAGLQAMGGLTAFSEHGSDRPLTETAETE
jgi:hypothetical protein